MMDTTMMVALFCCRIELEAGVLWNVGTRDVERKYLVPLGCEGTEALYMCEQIEVIQNTG